MKIHHAVVASTILAGIGGLALLSSQADARKCHWAECAKFKTKKPSVVIKKPRITVKKPRITIAPIRVTLPRPGGAKAGTTGAIFRIVPWTQPVGVGCHDPQAVTNEGYEKGTVTVRQYWNQSGPSCNIKGETTFKNYDLDRGQTTYLNCSTKLSTFSTCADNYSFCIAGKPGCPASLTPARVAPKAKPRRRPKAQSGRAGDGPRM